MISRLEKDLYWAYEHSQTAVLSRQALSDARGSSPHDLYAAHHASAKLQARVRALPALQCAVIEAKYGLLPESLYRLALAVSERFRLPENVAQGMVLIWLAHPMKPKLRQIADEMKVSDSTVKRLSQTVRTFLNDVRLQSLYALDNS